jgi:hypothetical protein
LKGIFEDISKTFKGPSEDLEKENALEKPLKGLRTTFKSRLKGLQTAIHFA